MPNTTLTTEILQLEAISVQMKAISQHQELIGAELARVKQDMETLGAEVIVYTERMKMLDSDMKSANKLREKLHRDVAGIQGGMKVVIFLASSGLALQLVAKGIQLLSS